MKNRWNRVGPLFFFFLLLLAVSAPPLLPAGDWPMWRCNPGRTAYTPAELPADLHLQWTRELPPPRRAWPPQQDDRDKLEFDLSYAPVAAGGRLFVPSMVSDRLSAYDLGSGEELWRFYADGPVRLAPAAWNDRVYFVSDDGHLYCLNAADGALLWKFRGGPSGRMVLGNNRVISMWPARGGPVIHEGIVYFTAGIWPFEGIFIYALDAVDGRVIWENSGAGSRYQRQQHGGAYAFAGIGPQGYLAIDGDTLVVPGGRTMPAGHDLASGDFRFVRLGDRAFGKHAGGYDVMAVAGLAFANRGAWTLADGRPHREAARPAVVSDREAVLYDHREQTLRAYYPGAVGAEEEIHDRPGRPAVREEHLLGRQEKPLWSATLPDLPERFILHLGAGRRLYGAARDGTIAAIDLPEVDRPAMVSWRASVDGQPWTMLASAGRLVVVTTDGRLYCFAAETRTEPAFFPLPETPVPAAGSAGPVTAALFFTGSGVNEGYALVMGGAEADLFEQAAAQTDLHLVGFEPDVARVGQLRRRLDEAGLYGTRVALLAQDPADIDYPPYISSLVAVSDPGLTTAAGFPERVFSLLRPYGGRAWLATAPTETAAVRERILSAAAGRAELAAGPGHLLVTRSGPLPGAGQWTHEYADAANSHFSTDSLVKAPLGVLWFGGPDNSRVLPRHGDGPVPQVAGGRLFIMGPDHFSARCVYTGRELWQVHLPGVGADYRSTSHQPGSNMVGSNYAVTAEGVYIVYHPDNTCLYLAANDGREKARFRLPERETLDTRSELAGERRWGNIRLLDDLLIAVAEPHVFEGARIGAQNWEATSGQHLVVMNRFSGQVLWTHRADTGFRHNAIAAGNGRIFIVDGLSTQAQEKMARRGVEANLFAEIRALDARSGRIIWRSDEEVFGTWLGYSATHNVLLEGGRSGPRGRHTLPDEPQLLRALDASDGRPLWSRDGHGGPFAIRGDTVIGARGETAVNIITGEPLLREHPLTGEETPWSFDRTYGCGSQNVSEHLITFRSGAAGYFDLRQDGGTGTLGGFRAGCTNNLVAADGVLNAPDYTRTCTCAYQLQTSLALVHRPDVETWTTFEGALPEPSAAILRLAVNLGAPGNRREDERFWFAFPPVRLDSIPVVTEAAGDGFTWRQDHSSRYAAAAGIPAWVFSSAAEGTGRLVSRGLAAGQWRIRLYFAETDEVETGERVFDILVQGEPVATALDIVAAAGGPRRPLVREFNAVVTDRLSVELRPAAATRRPPLLSGLVMERQ